MSNQNSYSESVDIILAVSDKMDSVDHILGIHIKKIAHFKGSSVIVVSK